MMRNLLILALSIPPLHSLAARDIRADLAAADAFGKKAPSLVLRDKLRFWWSADGGRLAYRVNTGPDNEVSFVQVDIRSGRKSAAFDHAALAARLSQAASTAVDPARIPVDSITWRQGGALVVGAFGRAWRIAEDGTTMAADDAAPVELPLQSLADARRTSRGSGKAAPFSIRNGTEDPVRYFWAPEKGRKVSYGTVPPGGTSTVSTFGGHLWLLEDAQGATIGAVKAEDVPSLVEVSLGREKQPAPEDRSPDGRWRAVLRQGNLFIQPAAGGDAIPLTRDGSAAAPYRPPFRWSPDSRKLVAHHCRKVEERKIHIVQSSPPGQLQPKLLTLDYAKPGDEIEQPTPCLFDIPSLRRIPLATDLYPNPWSISALEWEEDSAAFSFVYNQRGHQLLRVLRVEGADGATSTLIEERSATFIDYSQKFFLQRLPGTREILWASERSGWNHLYLIDGGTGVVKRQVTSGEWNVREVMEVDASRRTVTLRTMGRDPGNPYDSHFIRLGIDGGSVIPLTGGAGDHRIEFSPDGRSFIDSCSRVDAPPVVELRDASTGRSIAPLEQADDSLLRATGWARPERFSAKGRDGRTDIHGVIIRPRNFDPAKRYPVVEDIYAGPHDHFIPTRYAPWHTRMAIAELGFIVVKIDGMGANWRGKKFHDVAWKNLRDAGFPDRIAWMKAAASTRPWMDLSRVGIYGGSAGGQNTLAGLLHHGDFYRAGVADCGCHDNRMDKIWWNEAWLGWPVDGSYEENSNVRHAARLTGRLMLIVGEIDRNVDPASTSQVIAALEAADKDFEFVPIMNADHGAAETPYGKRRRAQFLVDTLGNPG